MEENTNVDTPVVETEETTETTDAVNTDTVETVAEVETSYEVEANKAANGLG